MGPNIVKILYTFCTNGVLEEKLLCNREGFKSPPEHFWTVFGGREF